MSVARKPAIRTYEVAAGILIAGDRVLIARRQERDHQGGRWEFPGGKRHAGETVEDCLRREMREEIGLGITVGPLWRALTHVYPDRRVSIYFYLCERLDGEPVAIECDEIRWVEPAALTALPFVEGDLAVLPDLALELAERFRAADREAARSDPLADPAAAGTRLPTADDAEDEALR